MCQTVRAMAAGTVSSAMDGRHQDPRICPRFPEGMCGVHALGVGCAWGREGSVLVQSGVDPFSMQLLSTLITRKSQCPQAGRLKHLMGLDDSASTIGAVLNSDRQGSGCCTTQQ